jgi:hypothetical protein
VADQRRRAFIAKNGWLTVIARGKVRPSQRSIPMWFGFGSQQMTRKRKHHCPVPGKRPLARTEFSEVFDRRSEINRNRHSLEQREWQSYFHINQINAHNGSLAQKEERHLDSKLFD